MSRVNDARSLIDRIRDAAIKGATVTGAREFAADLSMGDYIVVARYLYGRMFGDFIVIHFDGGVIRIGARRDCLPGEPCVTRADVRP